MATPVIDARVKITSRMIVEDRGYATPCWVSTRVRQPNGYVKIGHMSKTWLGHRLSYEVFVGPIPQGLTIDHLCRVRECVRPDHLEPVTIRENCMRGETYLARQVAQTHCHNGHLLSGENVYKRPDGKMTRECRECRREAGRRANVLQKALGWPQKRLERERSGS